MEPHTHWQVTAPWPCLSLAATQACLADEAKMDAVARVIDVTRAAAEQLVANVDGSSVEPIPTIRYRRSQLNAENARKSLKYINMHINK